MWKFDSHNMICNIDLKEATDNMMEFCIITHCQKVSTSYKPEIVLYCSSGNFFIDLLIFFCLIWFYPN